MAQTAAENNSGQKTSSGSRWKKWLRLILFVLFMTVIIAEVMLRLVTISLTPVPENLTLYQADPAVGWAFRPGAQIEVNSSEFHTQVSINSHGLRDQEYSYTRPEGVQHRVLVLGDSFAAAIQVNLEDAFHSLLEQHLGSSYEVINAGVDGYGPDQEMLYYETEGQRYGADVVLLMFTLSNDARDVSEDLIVQDIWRRLRTKPYFRLENGQLVLDVFPQQIVFHNIYAEPPRYEACNPVRYDPQCFLLQYSRILQLALDLSTVQAINSGQSPPAPLPADTPDWANAWEIVRGILQRLNVDAKANGAQLMVFFINDSRAVDPLVQANYTARYPAAANVDWTLPNRELARILNDLQIPYLDSHDAFAAAQQSAAPLYLALDGHWTPAGHQLAADLLYNWIRQQLGESQSSP